MKTPRNLNGSDLVKRLKVFKYEKMHQTGSHIIIRTEENGEHSLSVPNHKPLKVGTLDSILSDVAEHFGITKKEVSDRLFR